MFKYLTRKVVKQIANSNLPKGDVSNHNISKKKSHNLSIFGGELFSSQYSFSS